MMPSRPDEIQLCLTADICNAIFPEHREKRRWDEIMSAGIRLEETLSTLKADAGNPPKITWFVRADPWMRRRFGSSTFLFERHGAHLSRFAAKGHEIAWHPHLDPKNLKSDIRELPIISVLVRKFFPVTTVRIGEGYHTNELIQLMDQLHFTVDSTALPGRANSECRMPFDWLGTPSEPYFPNFNDYRSRVKNPEGRILEVPFTMLPIRLPGDQPGPSARYMNFSYYNQHFMQGVMLMKRWPSVLVGITHPAEITPPKDYAKKHSLLSFNESEPLKNIRFLISRLQSMGKKVRFSSIREIRESITGIDIMAVVQDDEVRQVSTMVN